MDNKDCVLCSTHLIGNGLAALLQRHLQLELIRLGLAHLLLMLLLAHG